MLGGRRARAFEGRGAPRAAAAMTGTRAVVPRARRDARTRALVRTCRFRRPVTWEVRRPPPIRSLAVGCDRVVGTSSKNLTRQTVEARWRRRRRRSRRS